MLHENLKKVRQELGLSMVKFSEKLEIPAMTLIHYERGERSPSAQLFIQLHKKLNINLNWLVTGEGEMFNQKIRLEQSQNEIEQIIYKSMQQILEKNGIIK